MEFEEVRYGMLMMVLCDREGRIYDVWISFGSVHEDRDRIRNVEIKIERLEVNVEEGQKALQRQIDGLQKQIDDLRTLRLWGFGILFSGMGILIGLWAFPPPLVVP